MPVYRACSSTATTAVCYFFMLIITSTHTATAFLTTQRME